MKKLTRSPYFNMNRTLLYASALLLFVSASCKKGIQTPAPTKTIDPPISSNQTAPSTGLNTFSALVNGKLFVPVSMYRPFNDSLNADYPRNYSLHDLTIRAHNWLANAPAGFAIEFTATAIQLHNGDQFNLVPAGSKTGISVQYSSDGSTNLNNKYSISQFTSGTITFTKVDTVNKILAGSFSLDVMNRANDKIEIRQGLFNVKYPQ